MNIFHKIYKDHDKKNDKKSDKKVALKICVSTHKIMSGQLIKNWGLKEILKWAHFFARFLV